MTRKDPDKVRDENNKRKAQQDSERASARSHDLGHMLHRLADSGFHHEVKTNEAWAEIIETCEDVEVKIQQAEVSVSEIFDSPLPQPPIPSPPVTPPHTDPQPLPEQPAPSIPTAPPVPTDDGELTQFVLNLTEAKWLGEWSSPIWTTVKKACQEARGRIPLFIGYNIPGRDNGNYSAGGLHTAQEFYNWYGSIADAIGENAAWVVVEPDALGLSPGLSPEKRKERFDMLKGVVHGLSQKPNIKIWLDASSWINAAEMALWLKEFPEIDGFSVNVSGYDSTGKITEWADQVSILSGKRYILDTSRNGRGNPRPGKWCNVTDTLIGTRPTLKTHSRHCEAYVWCKVPGESDGKGINDDGSQPRDDVPAAGVFWPEFKEAIYSGDWDDFKHKYRV